MIDLLFEFGKVSHADFGEMGPVMEVAKKLIDIEAKLGLNLFLCGKAKVRKL